MAARFAESGWSQGLINLKTRKWNGVGRLAAHKLTEPLSWRAPSTVFVNSMSDLFHENLTNEEIAAVFGVMAAAPQHTFQILTKRARRMREWFEWLAEESRLRKNAGVGYLDLEVRICVAAMDRRIPQQQLAKVRKHIEYPTWPLPNVWLGVSVENQDAADERIPELLATPAAIRFLSCEPLIGPVDLSRCGWSAPDRHGASETVDWVIAGCESGPGARPCDVAWLRSLRDQCAAASVAYFLKQARAHSYKVPGIDGELADAWDVGAAAGTKSKGGGVLELPYLDGVQHAAFPEVRP